MSIRRFALRFPSGPVNLGLACVVALALAGCLDEGKPREPAGSLGQLIGTATPQARTIPPPPPPPPSPTPLPEPAPAPQQPPANEAPTLAGSPGTAAIETQLYGFQPIASDPDGDALTFAIDNKPAWATFAASSGLLSGIPPAGSSGSYPNIRISVSDGRSVVTLPPFGITVVRAPRVNAPPSIAGIPPTSVATGSRYRSVQQPPIRTDRDSRFPSGTCRPGPFSTPPLES